MRNTIFLPFRKLYKFPKGLKIAGSYRRLAIFSLFFLTVTLASCATTPKQEKLTEAIPLYIQGTYEGRADIESNLMRVTISGPKMENISSYKNVRPLTGGNHVLVYFDTDPEIEGAEYGAFIYSDEISFRRRDGVDWYIQELTTLSYELKGGDVHFDIPLRYFDYKPFKAWTQRVDS